MDDVAAAIADPVRRSILERLRSERLPAGRIAAAFPISRPAISRHLRVLREAGLVREVATEEALTRYESNVEPHHHFVCRACGRLEDVPADAFKAPARLELEGGHEVEAVEVVLRGLCAACKGAT